MSEEVVETDFAGRDLRSRAIALYVPPFRYAHGYVYDSRGHMVADQGGSENPSSLGLRVRGWGRIGGMPESAALQDAVGMLMAELLTAHWPAETPKASSDTAEKASFAPVGELAFSFRARCEAAYANGRPVIVPWEEAERVKWLLFVLAQMLSVDRDHMSACDRIMGATHPCTCGADDARRVLSESSSEGRSNG